MVNQFGLPYIIIMKNILLLFFVFYLQSISSQVLLDADDPGNTYPLITSVLAPGYNPIEVPDCNHMEFGDHIDEVFDNALNENVFRFFIHRTPDNDRCINFDRQRNEIKTYDKSPDNLLGIEGETVVYKWKFKLAAGFQSSPNFTHLHQLKSVGGSLASMPMYTLTTRKGNPDRLELRYAETNSQVTLMQTSLTPFINTWRDADKLLQASSTILHTPIVTLNSEQKSKILSRYGNYFHDPDRTPPIPSTTIPPHHREKRSSSVNVCPREELWDALVLALTDDDELIQVIQVSFLKAWCSINLQASSWLTAFVMFSWCNIIYITT